MGSLLLPIGTLASLIWMHILKENHIKIKWKDYLKVSLIVIPLTTIVTLFLLFYWVQLIFLNTDLQDGLYSFEAYSPSEINKCLP